MEIDYANRFGVLAHPQRLAVFSLLLRRYPDEVAAGEIAGALDLKANTLSPYLTALRSAGFINQRRVGTSLLYAALPTGLGNLLDGFWADCCQGRPDLCIAPQSSARDQAPPFRVLFICTGNSARSIFAESLLNRIGGDRFEVYSAGTKPSSNLNPLALHMLEEKGHEVEDLRSKHMSEFQGEGGPDFDFVFTVCDRSANEDCPAWRGQPISGHWSTPDPVKANGTEAERMLAFQTAYGMLRNRIEAFVALPIDSLDRLSLQRAVDSIAQKDFA